MPRLGTLDVGAALPNAPQLTTLESPSWEMTDAQFLQVNWEVEDGPALDLTPPSLHPSIPPFASFFGGRYHDTPVGTFSLVQARLVVRAGIRPRALCLGAVCDSAAATDALRANWGYPVAHGEVVYSTRHDQVRFTASVDGHEVLDVAVYTMDVINGSDLMTFDNLNFVRFGDDGEGKLVQIDPEYTIHQADRGRPEVRLPDPQALGMNGNLKLAAPIVGFTFRADTDLVPPRFLIDARELATTSTKRVA
jgi:hypothetical protein